MAQISVQAELMTQTVAAGAISSSANFFVVQDLNNLAYMFSLGDDGLFNLIVKDSSGHNKCIVLNPKFNIPASSTIVALSVNQDVEGKTYLAFAEHVSPNSNNKVHLMSPIDLGTFDWTVNDLTPYLLRDLSGGTPTSNKVVNVKKFMLGTNDDSLGYPFSAITYTNGNNTLVDLASISVSVDSQSVPVSWTYNDIFVLPEAASASTISDMEAASVAGYRGLFCLYNVNQDQHLTFVAPDLQYGKQIQVIHNVTGMTVKCMTSFTDPTNALGYTAVAFAASDGLYWFSANDVAKQGTQSTVLSTDPAFAGCQEIYIAQSSSVVSVWAMNGLNQIVYQQYETDNMTAIASPVVLLPATLGGPFAALLHSDAASQHLYVLNSVKQMTLLEQSGTTRLWQTTPYVLPSTNINYNFTSFTAHIKITGADGLPVGRDKLAAPQVQLSCDSVMTVTVNGLVHTVSPTGVAVDIDAEGTVTILVPTDDISSPRFYVGDIPSATEPFFNNEVLMIDPSGKIKEKLAKITDSASLQQAFPSVSSQDATLLEQAATAVKALSTRATNCDSGSSSGSTQQPQAQVVAMSLLSTASLKEDLWDLWQGIVNDAEDVRSWAYPVLDDVLHFVVTTAKGIYKFVLTTAEHCLKAITYILQQIGAKIEELIQMLGFLFEWQDIMDTQKLLAGGFLKIMDLMTASIPRWALQADTWISGLESQVLNALQMALPSNVGSQQTSQSNMGTQSNSDSNTNSMREHPGANYLNYNMKHGSNGQSLTQPMDFPSAPTSTGDPIQDMFALIQDGFKTFETILSDVGKAIIDMFEGGFSPSSVQSTFNNLLQKIVHDAFAGLKQIIDGGAKLAVDVLTTFRGLITKTLPVDIPLITTLWNTFTGEPLTLLNVFTLVLAVPQTIITKLIFNAAPSTTSDFKSLQKLLSSSSVPAAEAHALAAPQSLVKAESAGPEQQNVAPQGQDSDDTFAQVVYFTQVSAALALPFASLLNVISSYEDWIAVATPTSKWVIAFGVLQSCASFPPDIRKPARPVIEMRVITFVCNLFSNVVVAAVNVRPARAVALGTIHAFRTVCVITSFAYDLAADVTVWPALNYGEKVLVMYEVNRLLALGKTWANLISMYNKGVNIYAAGAYYGLAFLSSGLSLAVVITKLEDGGFNGSVHMPPIDIAV